MDKTIRRVTDLEEQEAENYRYWQNRSVGDRLIAVCELSDAAYAFAAAFKGVPVHDDKGFQGSSAGIQRERG
jgi:hypothetical protein